MLNNFQKLLSFSCSIISFYRRLYTAHFSDAHWVQQEKASKIRPIIHNLVRYEITEGLLYDCSLSDNQKSFCQSAWKLDPSLLSSPACSDALQSTVPLPSAAHLPMAGFYMRAALHWLFRLTVNVPQRLSISLYLPQSFNCMLSFISRKLDIITLL